MKVSFRSGRISKNGTPYSADHCDRNFDTSLAEHIRQDMIDKNTYVKTYNVPNKENMTLKEYELEVYKNMLGKSVEEKNQRYIKNRHPERCKTVEQIYNSKKTCCEETIVQIGKKDNTVDSKTFKKAIVNLIREYQKRYKNYKVLDVSIHEDETTIHAHIRAIYIYHDKNGTICLGESKALKEMGFERPDPNKKEDRYNSAKQVFTETNRNLFVQICRDMGLDIDDIEKCDRKHLEKKEYIKQQLQKETQELQAEKAEIISEIRQLEQNGEFGVAINSAKEKSALKSRIKGLESTLKQHGIEIPTTFEKTEISQNKDYIK